MSEINRRNEYSPAFKTDFMLVFPSIPGVTFFCHDVVFPTINLPIVQNKIPWTDYPSPGDKITYQPLVVSFMVDEYYKNYLELFNWMHEMRPPDKDRDGKDIVRDCSIIIQNNNKISNMKVTFVDAFPIQLDGIQFNYTASGTEHQICNATFDFSYMKFEQIKP